MAIITTENDLYYSNGQVHGHKRRKYVTHEALQQTNQTRQGKTGWTKRAKARTRKHDPRTPTQLAYRACMKAWYTQTEQYHWNASMKAFFDTNVPRVLQGLPIIF